MSLMVLIFSCIFILNPNFLKSKQNKITADHFEILLFLLLYFQVYHYYNRNQFPFVFINIETLRTSVDVNVTPDKRLVYLQNEKYLCSLLRKTLETVFKNGPRNIPLNINTAQVVSLILQNIYIRRKRILKNHQAFKN